MRGITRNAIGVHRLGHEHQPSHPRTDSHDVQRIYD